MWSAADAFPRPAWRCYGLSLRRACLQPLVPGLKAEKTGRPDVRWTKHKPIRSRIHFRNSELDRERKSRVPSFLKNVAMRIRTGGLLSSVRYGAYRLRNASQLRRFGISRALADASEIVSRQELGLENP